MQNSIENIVEKISSRNALHGKKLRKNLKKFDTAYFNRAEIFLNKYQSLLINEGKTIEYAIDCYLQFLADVNYESVQFLRTGEYSSKSFDEVNKRVYSNPLVMEYYLHALLLRQFLLPQNYNILLFFNKVICQNSDRICRYLEVGGGHGLFVSEAINVIGSKAKFDLVDISQSAIDVAKMMISDENISFILSDISAYKPSLKYDFITMGEVLEHVENPVNLLQNLHSLLNLGGKLFITTITNAPAIDHIYLFRNADEIREVITSAGFTIEDELCIYSEDMPAVRAEKLKVSMMYAGVLIKKN